MTSHIPIFVISLPTSTERRGQVSLSFKRLGLEFEFFDAVDGREGLVTEHNSRFDETEIRTRMGRAMTGAEKGCALSHALLYRHILQRKLSYAIVMEDDMVPTPALLALIKSGRLQSSGVDLLLLYYCSSHAFKWSFRPFFGQHKLFKFSAQPNSAAAYFVTSEGTARLAQATDRITFVADWPILVPFVMRCAGIYPSVMEHSLPPSLLEEERAELNSRRSSREQNGSFFGWQRFWRAFKTGGWKGALNAVYFGLVFPLVSVQVAGSDEENARGFQATHSGKGPWEGSIRTGP